MGDGAVEPLDAAAHRRLAVELFNRSWRLLELDGRTPAQDDELIHCVHASRHHWGEVGTAANLARGESRCARIYAALGRGEPALHHANRGLELVRTSGEGFEDMGPRVGARGRRACQPRRRENRRRGSLRRARASGARADRRPGDREVIASQIADLGV